MVDPLRFLTTIYDRPTYLNKAHVTNLGSFRSQSDIVTKFQTCHSSKQCQCQCTHLNLCSTTLYNLYNASHSRPAVRVQVPAVQQAREREQAGLQRGEAQRDHYHDICHYIHDYYHQVMSPVFILLQLVMIRACQLH